MGATTSITCAQRPPGRVARLVEYRSPASRGRAVAPTNVCASVQAAPFDARSSQQLTRPRAAVTQRQTRLTVGGCSGGPSGLSVRAWAVGARTGELPAVCVAPNPRAATLRFANAADLSEQWLRGRRLRMGAQMHQEGGFLYSPRHLLRSDSERARRCACRSPTTVAGGLGRRGSS